MEKWLVGGAVRDILLGKEPHDRDYVATDTCEEELLRLGYKKVGKDFPVFLDPETREEVALPRKEVSTGKRHIDFKFVTEDVSLVEDLERRDLTINSMAMKDEDVLDLFGGRNDLENKVLRHTSEAFSEDPLRVLRLARFQCVFPDFSIAPETRKLASSIDLHSLTKERVFKELLKAFDTDHSYLFLKTLYELGQHTVVFPFLEGSDVSHNNLEYHAEGSVINHIICAMKAADLMKFSPEEKFAVFMHDAGKPSSYKKYGNFHSHTEYESLVDELKVPKKFSDLAKASIRLHHKIHNFEQLTAKTKVKMYLSIPRRNRVVSFMGSLAKVAMADSFGRIINQERELTLVEALERIEVRNYDLSFILGNFVAFADVNVKDLVGKMDGRRLKEELHKRRICAVKQHEKQCGLLK